jgi:hypothetical protein
MAAGELLRRLRHPRAADPGSVAALMYIGSSAVVLVLLVVLLIILL